MSTIKKSRSKIVVDDQNGLVLASGLLHANVAGRRPELTDGAALHEAGDQIINHIGKLESQFAALDGDTSIAALLQDGDADASILPLDPVDAPAEIQVQAEASIAEPETVHPAGDFVEGEDEAQDMVAAESSAPYAEDYGLPEDATGMDSLPADDAAPGQNDWLVAETALADPLEGIAADTGWTDEAATLPEGTTDPIWNDDTASLPAGVSDPLWNEDEQNPAGDPWASIGDGLEVDPATVPAGAEVSADWLVSGETDWNAEAEAAPEAPAWAGADDDEEAGTALNIGGDSQFDTAQGTWDGDAATAEQAWNAAAGDASWDSPAPAEVTQPIAEDADDRLSDPTDAAGADTPDTAEGGIDQRTPEIADLLFLGEEEVRPIDTPAEEAPAAAEAEQDWGAETVAGAQDWNEDDLWAADAPQEQGTDASEESSPEASDPFLLTPAYRLIRDVGAEESGADDDGMVYADLDPEQARRNGEHAGRVLEIDEIGEIPEGVVEEFPPLEGQDVDVNDKNWPEAPNEPVDIPKETVSQFDLSGDNAGDDRIPGDDRGNAAKVANLVAKKGSIMRIFSRKTVVQQDTVGASETDLDENGFAGPDDAEANVAVQQAPAKRSRLLPMLAASVAVVAIGAGAVTTVLPAMGIDLLGNTEIAQNSLPQSDIPVTTGTVEVPVASATDDFPVPAVPQDGAPGLPAPIGLAEPMPEIGAISAPAPEVVAGNVTDELLPAVGLPDESGLTTPEADADPLADLGDMAPLDIPLPDPVAAVPAQGTSNGLDQLASSLEAAKEGDLSDLMDRSKPVPGSLDATMQNMLSNYASMETLDEKLGGYVTDADLADVTGKLTDALDRLEGLSADLETRDQTIASLQAELTSTTELAARAEQLSIAQNEVLVKFVRMQEKVDLGEKLIVDLSQRMDVIERIDPADRVAVDRAMADLSSRVETISRDIGLIARYAINGDTARVSSPATGPSTAEGGDAVFVEADAKTKTPKLDRTKVPADAKKGDFVEGYGYVLDVRPTSSGATLVVMENGSAMID